MAEQALSPLADLLAARPDELPRADQPCWVDGERVNLHATLTRTAVVGPAVLDVGDERRLVPLMDVLVAADELSWQSHPRALLAARVARQRGRARGQSPR